MLQNHESASALSIFSSALRQGMRWRRFMAALLLVSMLVGQWAGFAHRIAHGGPGESSYALQAALQADTHGGAIDGHADRGDHHSCAAYDAATLAAAICLSAILLLLLRQSPQRVFSCAFHSWNAPPDRPFLSRAPPRA